MAKEIFSANLRYKKSLWKNHPAIMIPMVPARRGILLILRSFTCLISNNIVFLPNMK